jgi:DNA-binding CsgD family transcriptional regulator
LGMLWSARDYERAGEYRRAALEASRTIGEAPLVAHSLNRVGNWFVNREDPHSGIPYHDEALAIFERANDRRGIVETVDLLAMAHHIAGAEDTAIQLLERSIEIFEELEDRRGLVNALAVLQVCGPSHHSSAGPVGTSARIPGLLTSELPVKLAAEIGWRAGEAFSRYILADCLAWRGEYERALQLARESLSIAQEIEHREWQCASRRVLGVIALNLFDMPEALAQLKAAHDIALRLGSAVWIRWTAAPLAIALARAGRLEEAKTLLDDIDRIVPLSSAGDALLTCRTLGERLMTVARAEVAHESGASAAALELVSEQDIEGTPRAGLLRAQALAALERWDEATITLAKARNDAGHQGARPLLWRIDAAEGVVHLGRRRRIDARRSFDAARSTAAELMSGIDDSSVVAAFWAAVDLLAPPPAKRTAGQAAKAAHGGLTRRERDTAALIAQGKSNRAIARALGIGERTVEGYVASAFTKLGFSSRSQIAVWAVEQGLVDTKNAASRMSR